MAKNSNYHRQDLTRLLSENEALKAKNSQLENEVQRLLLKMDHMQEMFANSQRARFGQSSEKKSYVLENGQESLFNEAEAVSDIKAEEPTEDTLAVQAYTRKKKRSRDEIMEDIPVKKIIMELQEDQLSCDKCGGKLVLIGKKLIRKEIEVIPQQVRILEYYSCSYACDSCEKNTGYAHIVSLKTPPPLMKHSLASPSTVADVMTKKYADGLPLARQEKIWKRLGVELSRATMANWVIQCSKTWLKPLYRHMKQELLKSSVIHADETVIQVLKEEGKPATSESRMWVYSSGERESKPIRIFEYQPDRSGKRAETFLKGFSGCLVTDGYSGYNNVANVTHCGCWAHARRKWREAMPDGATVKTSKAAVGFNYCGKLAAKERICAQMSNEDRKEYRQNVVLPILEEYFCWLDTVEPERGGKLEAAVRYSKNLRPQLSAFIEHGDVPMTNNLAENAIRPFVLGRKNWLFSDTPRGAESSAIVYSLVETAKANGVEPYEYLFVVLSMLPYWGAEPSHEKLETLMPWHPDVKQHKNLAQS